MLRILLLSCLVAFACAQCGCNPAMIRDENGLPKPDPVTGLYEGDMRLTSDNFLEILGLRNTVSNLWPNRILYYSISPNAVVDANGIATALRALQSALGNCVRFEKRTNQKNYVEVINGSGCYSNVGMRGGRQELSLRQGGCSAVGTIQHEFIHALGLYHEQSRADRDNFITVHWANISSISCNNFYKKGSLPAGFPAYDFKSIMHYRSLSFTCNGKNTLTTKAGGTIDRNSLTSLDVAKIRALYKC